MYTIYKATNVVNNKCYVGFAQNFNKRILGHKSAYKKGSNKFYNAIKKYGWENFKWEILFESDDKKECLTIKEPYFIKLLDSVSNGYNTTPGGECNPLFGKDNGMYGKTHPPEVKNKLSALASDRFKGKSYSEMYGEDRANKLKKIRSLSFTGKNNKAQNNPRFSNTLYLFFNESLNIVYISTRYFFMIKYHINKTTVHEIINGHRRKGWMII